MARVHISLILPAGSVAKDRGKSTQSLNVSLVDDLGKSEIAIHRWSCSACMKERFAISTSVDERHADMTSAWKCTVPVSISNLVHHFDSTSRDMSVTVRLPPGGTRHGLKDFECPTTYR